MVNPMSSAEPRFIGAFPYQASVLALPVTDIDAAVRWYSRCFGMVEVERRSDPVPTVVMERDGTRIGFSVNGGDPSQDGAAILVSGIGAIRSQLEASGVKVSEWGMDEREGRKLRVFFVVAPDGLCYQFHEPI
jgi:catechol 2,3-dioxygenase-like lactoylglutathione lyase family enzyme